MHFVSPLVGVLVVLTATTTNAVDSVTLAAGFISRHGDREILTKSGFTEYTEGILTPQGYTRMTALGKHIRETVGERLHPKISSLNYNEAHKMIKVSSSGFDRTISSGNAILEGLLGNLSKRPVVFSEKDEEDITLRAYAKCKSFQDSVQRLRANESYALMETQTRKEREQAALYAGIPIEQADDFDEVWNIYDGLLVMLSDGRGEDNETLAHIDTMKRVLDYVATYEYQAARHHPVMGVFLKEVNDFIESVSDTSSETPVYRHWVAHYPTLVCCFIIIFRLL